MDKQTLIQFLKILPDDATEISIPRHDSNEVIFNSDAITKETAPKIGAIPAQKGTYRGTKRRWRVLYGSAIGMEGIVAVINTDNLPRSD